MSDSNSDSTNHISELDWTDFLAFISWCNSLGIWEEQQSYETIKKQIPSEVNLRCSILSGKFAHPVGELGIVFLPRWRMHTGGYAGWQSEVQMG